jgi:hypothetical protein
MYALTTPEAKRYHQAIVASERREIEAIKGGEPCRHSSLPLEAQQSVLQALEQETGRLERHTSSNIFTARPTPGLYLIAQAFKELPYQRGVAQQRLTGFLRDILFPLVRIYSDETPTTSAVSTRGSTVCTCLDAEARFEDATRQVATKAYRGQATVRSYYDQDGQTVAFGKTALFPTALLLQPVALYDALIPAGTLVTVDTESVVTTHHRQYGVWCVEACQVTHPLHITPARVSPLAYAGTADKLLFAVNGNSSQYDRALGNLVSSLTIARFQDMAAQILSDCQVMEA